MKTIPLTHGSVAIVDDDDYESISLYGWSECPTRNMVYIKRKDNGVLMHREIMNAKKGDLVDHKNHDTFDNRKANLRFCTPSQNRANSRPSKGFSSRYKGVYWCKGRRKWNSAIKKNNIAYHIASCENEEDAAIYYNVAAQIFHGEFAYLNDV